VTPFEKRITAAAADIDELGHVNNAAWVCWIQDHGDGAAAQVPREVAEPFLPPQP
jgi:acyl-CoA thioester hydrolase